MKKYILAFGLILLPECFPKQRRIGQLLLWVAMYPKRVLSRALSRV